MSLSLALCGDGRAWPPYSIPTAILGLTLHRLDELLVSHTRIRNTVRASSAVISGDESKIMSHVRKATLGGGREGGKTPAERTRQGRGTVRDEFRYDLYVLFENRLCFDHMSLPVKDCVTRERRVSRCA